MAAQGRQVRARNLNGGIEIGVGGEGIFILQRVEKRGWGAIRLMVRKSVDQTEIIIFIAVCSGGEKPHKSLHSSGQVVDKSARHIFCLHGFVRTYPCRNRIKLIVEEWNVTLDARMMSH